MDCKLGIVLVSYDNREDIASLVRALQPQLKSNDKLIVVDNKKPYQLNGFLQSQNIKVQTVNHDNGGYGAGCNFGAAKILDEVDVLLFLNPDTFIKQPDYLDRMRLGWGRYAAWQSLMLLPDGRVNSLGNKVHITGLTWSDGFNTFPSKLSQEVLSSNLSGACLAIDTAWWRRINGFTEDYFMYFEDVDLSTKILIAGGKMARLNDAEIYHHYNFEKGAHKWQYIERNRQMFMLINWPLKLLVLTALPNIFFNILIFLQYTFKGRPGVKIRSDIEFLKSIPLCLRLRRQRQKLWSITSKQYLDNLGYEMNSELLGKITNNRLVCNVMKLYCYALRLFFV